MNNTDRLLPSRPSLQPFFTSSRIAGNRSASNATPASPFATRTALPYASLVPATSANSGLCGPWPSGPAGIANTELRLAWHGVADVSLVGARQRLAAPRVDARALGQPVRRVQRSKVPRRVVGGVVLVGIARVARASASKHARRLLPELSQARLRVRAHDEQARGVGVDDDGCEAAVGDVTSPRMFGYRGMGT
ncbi:Uncharacterized protein TCAP_01008 [Tolypocladium capitatum]|uniref:Uncharacterized protein n=1 Tax=Tolypocladium capitatum TaxID=45235 RepID=A0A2K3QNF9_9HYPO|nr:Uncharacterized protein TCAP_01008 [Tolypocladium capitatum]